MEFILLYGKKFDMETLFLNMQEASHENFSFKNKKFDM